MWKRLVIAAAVVLVWAAVRAEEENPYKKAKVGDWVEYKVANKMGGISMDMEMKHTVVKKTDAEITIEYTSKVAGQEIKNSITHKLDVKYDPLKASLGDKGDAEMKQLDKGEETLTVGGKTLKTTWMTYEATTKSAGGAMTMKGKSWVSPEIPLGGVVKSETDLGAMGKQSMELKDFGSGK